VLGVMNNSTTLAALHYVPGHWCLLVVDLNRRQIPYYESFYESPCAEGATLRFCGICIKNVSDKASKNSANPFVTITNSDSLHTAANHDNPMAPVAESSAFSCSAI